MDRRTTLVAEEDDLQTLQQGPNAGNINGPTAEGRDSRKATELRAARKPRFGLGKSKAGSSQASVDDEASPARTPYGPE